MASREPINIDPNVRDALRAHLFGPKYSGTGVGYSEFIRRAILTDGGNAPESVQADTRTIADYTDKVIIALDEDQATELEQLLIDISYKAMTPEEINWPSYNMDRLFETLHVVEEAGVKYRNSRTTEGVEPTDIEAQIAEIDARRAVLGEQQEPIMAELKTLYNKRQKLRDELAAAIDPTTDDGLNRLAEIAWSGGSGSRVGSDRLDTYFRSLSPEIRGHVWLATVDKTVACPQIWLTRNQDISSLAQALPPLMQRLGHNFVRVFEHTLSEHGSYHIEVESADHAALIKMVYGRPYNLKEGTVSEVLKFTAQSHWYKENEDEL